MMTNILNLPTEKAVFAEKASELIKRSQKAVVMVMGNDGNIEIGTIGCNHFEAIAMIEYGKLTYAAREQ